MGATAGEAHASLPTRDLISRARGGDPSATEALYVRYLPVLHRWARGRMPVRARDLNDTGDLVQETLVRTLRSLATMRIEKPGAFFAYLRTAMLNRIRDEARRISRIPPMAAIEDVHATPDPSPVEELVGREKLASFERAMTTLSDDEREAVMARIELNLSYAEVAAALGKASPDAARMAVTRALAKLARQMAADEGGR